MDTPSADDLTESDGSAHRRPVRLRSWIAGFVVVVIVAAAWSLYRAYQVDHSLHLAQDNVSSLRSDVNAQRWGALDADAANLQRHSEHAVSATHDLQWVIASRLPWLGANVRAVTTVAKALHEASTKAVTPLIASRTFAAVQQNDDGVSALVTALSADGPALTSAAAEISQAETSVSAISTHGLWGPLGRSVTAAQVKLGKADADVAHAASLTETVPDLLGTRRDATLLLVFQTPAEERGTGGLIGAWGEIRAHAGSLSLVQFGPDDDLPTLSSFPSGVSPDIQADYGVDPLLPLDANLSASFPDAARLIAASWTAGPGKGTVPDAVMSIDPVGLGQLLTVIGPVQTSSGLSVTSANAASLLLRGQYANDSGGSQASRVQFMAEVTKAVFARIKSGGYSSAALAKELSHVASTRRLMIWSPSDSQEAAWKELDLAGDLGPVTPATLRFAVNSMDASKLGAYLHTSIAVTNCASGGPVMTMTFLNDSPASLPDYAESHVPGLGRTAMRLTYSVYLSPEWGIAGSTSNGQTVAFSSQLEQSWRLIRATFDVIPGKSTVVVLRLEPGGTNRTVQKIVVTPQSYGVPVAITDSSSCR
jgi:hypothetical protein